MLSSYSRTGRPNVKMAPLLNIIYKFNVNPKNANVFLLEMEKPILKFIQNCEGL